jgi:hypothetical protein
MELVFAEFVVEHRVFCPYCDVDHFRPKGTRSAAPGLAKGLCAKPLSFSGTRLVLFPGIVFFRLSQHMVAPA